MRTANSPDFFEPPLAFELRRAELPVKYPQHPGPCCQGRLDHPGAALEGGNRQDSCLAGLQVGQF